MVALGALCARRLELRALPHVGFCVVGPYLDPALVFVSQLIHHQRALLEVAGISKKMLECQV